MSGSVMPQCGEPGEGDDCGALAALAHAARRVQLALGNVSDPRLRELLATAMTVVAEATDAAEVLAERQADAARIASAADESGYARGYAAGAASRHLALVRG